MACTETVCGTGGWTGPKPGDPDNNSVLTATPAFGGIDVSWTYPTVNPHAVAHTRLYRGISADFGTALLIRMVDGDFYYDKQNADREFFYWIQFVSINGTIGDLIGPVSAVARPMIDDLIEILTEKIDSGVLAQSLKAKLDEISILNANLLQEITDRETGLTSLAQAIADAQEGTAEALAFINTEIGYRTTADSAIAEQIDTVATTLGGSIAAVNQSMSTEINRVDGELENIGARWSVNLNVNGLIGGFGTYNDGNNVQAGFDVDSFWVGRTNANKRKPFIIEGNEVLIDEAVINSLTFNKLQDATGNFVVDNNGQIKAQYLRTEVVYGGAFTGYAWPAAGSKGFYLGPQGLLLGNANGDNGSGTVRGYLQLTDDGRVYAPGLSIEDNVLTVRGDVQATSINAGSANIVSTLNIAGNAVTFPVGDQRTADSGGSGATAVAYGAIAGRPILVTGFTNGGPYGSGSWGYGGTATCYLQVYNGGWVTIATGTTLEMWIGTDSTGATYIAACAMTAQWTPSYDGDYTFRVVGPASMMTGITILVGKR